MRCVLQVSRCLQRALCNRVASYAAGIHTSSTSGTTSRSLFTDQPPAFVFDIDGVLIRGDRVLEPAKAALQQLYIDGRRPRYPICFLTNGGGVTEERKAQQLSQWLGVKVSRNQVVLSHTPFRSLAASLGNKPVLVAGVGEVTHVAGSYGFRHVVTSADLASAAHLRNAVPFWSGRGGSGRGGSLPAPGECVVRNLGIGTSKRPIEAILVFKDPGDWLLELQIMTDVIMGGGVMGKWTQHRKTDAQTVKVFFSNPDLLWATDYPAPRFGQGAFAAALKTLHLQVTGRELQHQFFGKPNRAPYALAEQLLMQQGRELGLLPDDGMQHEHPEAGVNTAFSAIYAVGDNPKADIAGARNQGSPWVPVLVRTGVFSEDAPNDAEHPADMVVDDVAGAVAAALHRTRSSLWHSMR